MVPFQFLHFTPCNYSRPIHESDPLASAALLSDFSCRQCCTCSQKLLSCTTQDDLENLPDISSNTGPIIIRHVSTSITTTEVNGSIMFAADEGLRWLADCPDWYLDGTFKVAPPLFKQVFTIRVVRDRKTVPCVHSLLSSKRKVCYRGVVRNIKNVCEEHHIQLTPATVMVDFEVALMAARSVEIPATILHGCNIHFRQAIWPKTQFLGLVQQYRDNNEVMPVY